MIQNSSFENLTLNQTLFEGKFYVVEILESTFENFTLENQESTMFDIKVNYSATFEDNTFNEVNIGKVYDVSAKSF